MPQFERYFSVEEANDLGGVGQRADVVQLNLRPSAAGRFGPDDLLAPRGTRRQPVQHLSGVAHRRRQADPLDVRVGQSPVTLDVLVQYTRLGMKPEEIARGLDTLTLADVHGALAYYFRHETEIDSYLRRREEEAEKLRQEIEAANASRLAPLKARLDAVRAQGDGGHAPAPD